MLILYLGTMDLTGFQTPFSWAMSMCRSAGPLSWNHQSHRVCQINLEPMIGQRSVAMFMCFWNTWKPLCSDVTCISSCKKACSRLSCLDHNPQAPRLRQQNCAPNCAHLFWSPMLSIKIENLGVGMGLNGLKLCQKIGQHSPCQLAVG